MTLNNTISVGDLVKYKGVHYYVNLMYDNKSMCFIEKERFYHERDILKYCKVVDTNRLEVVIKKK